MDAVHSDAQPADTITAQYFRSRRYIGSKDRRAVSDMAYGVLRAYGQLSYLAARLDIKDSARSRVMLWAAVNGIDAAEFCDGSAYAPPRLSSDETAAWQQATKLSADFSAGDIPEAARLNVPDWAEPGLRTRFGDKFADAARALNSQAPFDIRINTLKAQAPPEDLGDWTARPRIKTAFRATGHLRVTDHPAYRSGVFDIQDEAAQIGSALVAVRPGMAVLDLCAGAGGKSLAVAAEMQNSGTVTACDINRKRLGGVMPRAARAGASCITTKLLNSTGEDRQRFLDGIAGSMDRVIVDAPCSGAGTWRRSPEQRWRYSRSALADFTAVQLALLQEGAAAVKTGGRLVYMTCSVLEDENEAVVARFLDASPGFRLMNYRDVWQTCTVLGTALDLVPETLSTRSEMLQLAPHIHDCDGFFVAILERINA